MATREQEIRNKIMSEMTGTSGISMNKILSASRGDETADNNQVEILAGP